MGKYKSYALLGVAVVVALFTSVLIYASLQKKGQRARASLPTQPVAVAVADLAWGTALTREMVRTVPFLKTNLPRGSFSDPAQLVDRVLVHPVKASEPIFESRLAPVDIKTGGVAAVITPQKRAVAVKVDSVIGVAGFVHAGNRVDVLVTITSRSGSRSDPITKVVLENILVLAAGPEVEQKGKEPANVNVITLEVTPQEAEKLALAATEGKLQLALRNFGDAQVVRTRGTTVPTLLASYTEQRPAPRRRPKVRKKEAAKPVLVLPEKKSVYTVEVVNGDKVSKVIFER